MTAAPISARRIARRSRKRRRAVPRRSCSTIGNPGDDRFAYNVTQEDKPWPVPVMVVAGKDRAVFERAIASGAPVTLDVAGRYQQNVAGRNVVARLGAGKGPVMVVSRRR